MKLLSIAALLLLSTVAVQPARAQNLTTADPQATSRAALAPRYNPVLDPTLLSSATSGEPAAAGLPLPKYGGWVGFTKWVTLAAAIGFGAAGAVVSQDADEIFRRLELLCGADADNCRSRNPDGSYTDPILEQMYQDVAKKDQQARAAFLAAEVSFGISVVLFIVDFQRKGGPENKPYDPDDEQKALQLSAVPGEVVLRYYFH